PRIRASSWNAPCPLDARRCNPGRSRSDDTSPSPTGAKYRKTVIFRRLGDGSAQPYSPIGIDATRCHEGSKRMANGANEQRRCSGLSQTRGNNLVCWTRNGFTQQYFATKPSGASKWSSALHSIRSQAYTGPRDLIIPKLWLTTLYRTLT